MAVLLLGARKSKIEVVLLTYMEPRSEGQKVKNLLWQNRVENLIFIILGRFSVEKTQFRRLKTIFSEMVDFRIGPLLTSL